MLQLHFASWLACVSLYLLLNCSTIRRLRANPRTQEHLGVEWTHGWAALNVAMAISWPRAPMLWLDQHARSDLHARADLLRAHTTRLDRVLARACYVTHMVSALSFVMWWLGRAWS